MTITLSNFTSETQLTTSEETMVETQDGVTATGQKKFIGTATATNTSIDSVELTVWRLDTSTTGVAGSGGNWILKRTIAANSTEKIDSIIGHVLGPGMKISALASVDAVVNIDISGTTES